MTKTITNHVGPVTTSVVTITSTIVPTAITWCSKTYRQCQGSAWPASAQCSSCGAYVGTGGTCLALVEIVPQPACTHECDDECRG